MIDLQSLAYFAVLGICVGFLAGLLGIGGGTVLVPVLTSIFLVMGIEPDYVVHLALGTSMASIVLTSVSSLLAHHKRGGVQWPIVKVMTPGILLGATGATFLVGILDSTLLATVFALFLLFVAWQMLRNKKPRSDRQLPDTFNLFLVGSGIGTLSTLVSIGGGSVSVPFFLRHNIPVTQAIGTSAALGFPIAVFGACGYWIVGEFFSDSPHGYIDFQAVAAISLLSIIFAPLGVRAAYKVPVALLKKVFAVLLVGLSIKMLVTVVL